MTMKKVIIFGLIVILFLNIAYANHNNTKVLDFYIGDYFVDENLMINLLHYTDFEYAEEVIWIHSPDGQSFFEQNVYAVNILREKNYTYRKCLVLIFLRKHPEILARFPEIDDEDSNIPMWKIDGINCLNTQGGDTGGSSGGGGAVAPSNEAASASRKWDVLATGSSAVLAVNNENIAVTGVVVDVKNAVSNAELKVASLNSNPLSTAAAAKVYQYLQITRSNIADTDASKIAISFRVPKSWLIFNKIANVSLYRHNGSSWSELPTVIKYSDVNNMFYEATTSRFSVFAIGIKTLLLEEPKAIQKPKIVNWHMACGNQSYYFKAYDDAKIFCDNHILMENIQSGDNSKFIEFIDITQSNIMCGGVAIWNQSLTTDDIIQLYQGTRDRKQKLSRAAIGFIISAIISLGAAVVYFFWSINRYDNISKKNK